MGSKPADVGTPVRSTIVTEALPVWHYSKRFTSRINLIVLATLGEVVKAQRAKVTVGLSTGGWDLKSGVQDSRVHGALTASLRAAAPGVCAHYLSCESPVRSPTLL